MLIAASAVAAVFGVGAVSYAMWTAGDSTPATVEGPTGMVQTIGDITVTATAGGDYVGTNSTTSGSMNKLLPIDYLGEAEDGVAKYWAFDVSLSGNSVSVNVTLSGTIKSGNKAVNATLYYTTTQPTFDSDTNYISNFSSLNGKALSDAGQTITVGTPVYVYMVAYGTNAMDASINLTFTATTSTS